MAGLLLHLDPLEAVTFDAWGTLLVDADPAATHSALVRLVAKHGNDEAPARAALDMAWTRHYDSWSDGLASGAFDLANETLRLLGPVDERAATDLAAAFSAQVLEAEIHAIDGARETLRFLCDRGLRLGLICDTGFATGAVVRQLLDREGLGEWLGVQIYSDEWGVPKPHPRVFLAAIAALDVSAERAVHVGDLLRTDVAGARAVGMATVRITAAYDDPAGLPEADLVVASHAALRRTFDAASAGPRRRLGPASLVPHSLRDDEDRLDRRIRGGRLEGDQLDAVASRLAERHRTARCDEETSFPGTVEKLSTEIQRLTESLHRKGEEPGWLPEVEGFLIDFVLHHADRLRERVLAKRILGIHGHLAASAVSVSDDGTRVRLADPFSTPLGAAYGDAVRDIVDLYGELRDAGLCRHADRFVSAYAEAALDYRLHGILEFHARLQALRRRVWYGAVASSAGSGPRDMDHRHTRSGPGAPGGLSMPNRSLSSPPIGIRGKPLRGLLRRGILDGAAMTGRLLHRGILWRGIADRGPAPPGISDRRIVSSPSLGFSNLVGLTAFSHCLSSSRLSTFALSSPAGVLPGTRTTPCPSSPSLPWRSATPSPRRRPLLPSSSACPPAARCGPPA